MKTSDLDINGFFGIFRRLYAEKWLKIDHFWGKIIARILRNSSLYCEFGPSKCEAKAMRTLFFFLRSEAKRIRNFAFAFAIMRNSHCECTPLVQTWNNGRRNMWAGCSCDPGVFEPSSLRSNAQRQPSISLRRWWAFFKRSKVEIDRSSEPKSNSKMMLNDYWKLLKSHIVHFWFEFVSK